MGAEKTAVLKAPTRVAVVPVGYQHGFGVERPRPAGLLGTLGRWRRGRRLYVRVNGQRARVIGSVGVSETLVDVTDLKCSAGDVVSFDLTPCTPGAVSASTGDPPCDFKKKVFAMSRTVSFQPLLFGGDINVYSVARAFHEAYGVKSVAFGKFHTFPCAFSSIIDYRTCPDNEDPAVFLSNVEKVALEFSHKTVIVLGCGDSYVQLCAHLKDQFPRNVVAPYIDGALLDRLINKEHFYELCDQHGIDHPATFIYDGSMGHDFTLPFGPPYVAKPADSVAYWEHDSRG